MAELEKKSTGGFTNMLKRFRKVDTSTEAAKVIAKTEKITAETSKTNEEVVLASDKEVTATSATGPYSDYLKYVWQKIIFF